MANLMITKQCNLHCSYCFANEFVNKQKDIMSFENFMKCMKFLSYNPKENWFDWRGTHHTPGIG